MPTRRTFVKGLALSGTAASLGLLHRPVAAEPGRVAGVLEGTEFDLRIGETRVDITGRERTALTINGSLPWPAAALARGRHRDASRRQLAR